ncbi:unnamed protein product [Bursaphelenchus okinawaensis]|uniref:Uncharacterized protein n=1 Tax=Bursaphelenchus okinawaensis TaxID=465554 RepID=A0A811JQM5_9BILA|nr:unnamed protein product [Bursaphelenchus okinawaensis]CAG9078456.1 unnamed protein product [Bursaphelenchus okinawaensis]
MSAQKEKPEEQKTRKKTGLRDQEEPGPSITKYKDDKSRDKNAEYNPRKTVEWKPMNKGGEQPTYVIYKKKSHRKSSSKSNEAKVVANKNRGTITIDQTNTRGDESK